MIDRMLAPWVDAVRLSLHVLAATVWVGGQLTLAGLVPTLRGIDPSAPRLAARRFNRIAWVAFAVLVITGLWNVSAVGSGHGVAYDAVLFIKITVVALSGLSAFFHSRSRTTAGLAVWGAMSGLTAVGALVLGVFLAG